MSAEKYQDVGTDVVELRDITGKFSIFRWKSYSANSHFLTPTDGWSFTVGGESLTDEVNASLVPGSEVQLVVDGNIQISGYIDAVERRANRGSGLEFEVSGRDKLAPAVDCIADPRLRFKPTMTFRDVASMVFERFNLHVSEAQGADRQLKTGEGKHKHGGVPARTPAKRRRKALKDDISHDQKPHPNEGAFAFVARILQRAGLWAWLAGDGSSVIIGKPDFGQAPMYSLVRGRVDELGLQTNILDGTATLSVTEQPSIIVAEGIGGGGEFGKSKLRVYMVNPLVSDSHLSLAEVSTYPSIVKVEPPTIPGMSFKANMSRPIYLHDEESKTIGELEDFVRREMALRLRKAFTYKCTVVGHRDEVSGRVWNVDTIARVDDRATGVSGDFWVLSRTFKKSRSGGSTTELELILPHSLEF